MAEQEHPSGADRGAVTRAAQSRVALLAAVSMLLAGSLLPAAAAATCQRTSLPAIEKEVMCPICGVPLVNAGGQQAENERDFIRERVEKCESKEEIKAALVAEYGEEVLAVPGTSGFDLAAYLVPIAGLALAATALAIGALRWRRARDQAEAANDVVHDSGDAGGDGSGDGDSLDADLRRYDL